jgi:membrane fusion protein (multidrug efflux system)
MSMIEPYRLWCFSCLFFLWGCSSGDKKTEAPKPVATPPTKADGFIVSPQLLSQDIEVPGSLAPYEEVELHPEIPGRVTGVYFKEGSYVFGTGKCLIKNFRCRPAGAITKITDPAKNG